jgi:MFS family permease
MEKSKVFYGWIVLIGLFVIYAITNGVILNTLPLFYPELIKEYGWTQDQVTRPAQLLFLLVAIFSPLIGNFMDRLNVKRMMLAGGVMILIGFVLFSRIQSINMLLMAYFIFAIGITLAGIIPSMKIVTNWFVKSRGLAVGILLVGSSLGGALFNPIAGIFIASQGWRTALLSMGMIASVLIFVPLIVAVVTHPDLKSLLPDGNQQESEGSKGVNQISLGYSDVFKSGVFYLMLFITGSMWFCIVGIIQHQVLFIKDLNSTVSPASLLSVFFVFSVFGKVIFGKLSDKYPKKSIMFLAVCNLALGALILTIIKSNPDTLLWVYAIVFGVGFSGTFTMIQLLIAEYYHGPSYGKILGLFTMIDTLAGVFGIMTLGKMRTNLGSYDQSFIVLLILSVVSAVCVLLLPKKELK